MRDTIQVSDTSNHNVVLHATVQQLASERTLKKI